MKFKFKHVQAGILIFFFVLSSACQKQKTGWQGSIEEENGIKVVNNPAEPLYGELVLELEEDLAIGSIDDENTTFYQIGGIAVDSQDNMFVMDSGNQRIQKYDKEGNYLQTIGRKGQGPGEFTRPFEILLDEQDRIYVMEIRKMHVFDPKGNSMKDINLQNFMMGFTPGADGNILAHGFVRAEQGQNYGVVIIDQEGKITKTLAEFEGTRLVARGDTLFSLSHEYTPHLGFSPVQQTGAVYGYNPEYTLFLTDRSGDTILIIKKDEPDQPITRKEKDKIIDEALERTAQDGARWPRDVVEEGANFPDHRPFFDGITSDNKGRIFVRKNKSVLDESTEVEFDIFSNDGYFLYTTKLSFTPILIKDGYLYKSTYLEETSEYKVIRYKIKNWEKIKGGIS
jgi:hypothetical protein